MFFQYIQDIKSWIAFFGLSLGAVNLLIWLDPGIGFKLSSLVYLNVLLAIAFAVFLAWRYRQEMAYTRKLAVLAEEPAIDWFEALPDAVLKRDEQINKVLQHAGTSFSREVTDIRKQNLVQGDYITSWVHEAKAPLTAMKLLIDSNRTSPGIDRIQSEWLRLYLLIDQQLYISRLPALESDYLPEETRLSDLVSGEVRELMSWCREKNIAIEMEELDKTVVADPKWSRFVIRQILLNAVKYSPQGGTVWISAHVERTGHMMLSIRDEGPGIPLHDMPRIFDKGFTGGTGRLHNAATGLGLYLAKNVSDKIGLTLFAESMKGQGTTMTVGFSLENDFDRIRK